MSERLTDQPDDPIAKIHETTLVFIAAYEKTNDPQWLKKAQENTKFLTFPTKLRQRELVDEVCPASS